jgi:hypothetical protein
MDNRKPEHSKNDRPKAHEKRDDAQKPHTAPDADHTEGRDRPPSRSDRDQKGPWLGGG